MAHTCPDCGQICHCKGDIDDLQWDDDSPEAMGCVHFKQCEEEYDNGEEDDMYVDALDPEEDRRDDGP